MTACSWGTPFTKGFPPHPFPKLFGPGLDGRLSAHPASPGARGSRGRGPWPRPPGHFTVFKTALGWAGLVASRKGIVRVYTPRPRRKELLHHLLAQHLQARPDYEGLKEAIIQVRDFLAKKRRRLTFALDRRGLPSFHRKVYAVLKKIPYGQVRTYAWVAQACGHPKAARAVGNALARNPFPLIVPCHRVIKSDGKLGGFGGGTKLKKTLLRLEGCEP